MHAWRYICTIITNRDIAIAKTKEKKSKKQQNIITNPNPPPDSKYINTLMASSCFHHFLLPFLFSFARGDFLGALRSRHRDRVCRDSHRRR